MNYKSIRFYKATKKLFIGNVEIYGYIYRIRNSINNKVYIGRTCHMFTTRYGSKWWEEIKNTSLKSDIDEYGYGNFEVEIIDIAFSNSELNIKEDFYISVVYDSTNSELGYNSRRGGDAFPVKEQTKVKISKSHSGKVLKETTKEKLRIANLGKKQGVAHRSNTQKSLKTDICDISGRVVQIDFNTHKYINTFLGANEAEKITGTHNSKISLVCRGIRNHTNGYIWLYEEDYIYFCENKIPYNQWRDILKEKYKGKTLFKCSFSLRRNIVALTLEYEYIKTFSGLEECAVYFNICSTNIPTVCRGKARKIIDTTFLYEEDYIFLISSDIPKSKWREYLNNKYIKTL